jgi:hypothetical protein
MIDTGGTGHSLRRGWSLLAFAFGALGACGTASDSAPASSAANGMPADSISLEGVRALVEKVGAETLFERVAEPDAYLADAFGIQVLQSVPAAKVLANLVPDRASLVSRDPQTLVLDFMDGPRVVFRYDTRLVFNGQVVDVPYARIVIADSASYPAEPLAFRDALVDAGLADAYLVPNPYYAAEQAVSLLVKDGASIETVTPGPDTTGFGAASHAAIMVGETHGGTAAYDRARALLESPAVGWIAIEMLPEDLQDAVDAFLSTAAGDGRTALLDYYHANWNTRGHEVTADPADNPYFRLIDVARNLGKPVYALDTETRYILFRFGEFPLGATVRDFVWASNVPDAGRGVLYGGSSHFLQSRKPNMLTFLRERFPDMKLFESEGTGSAPVP